MLRIHKLIAMSAILFIAALTSGCYTMVGYPPGVEESIIKEEAAEGQIYRDYGYYYHRPYSYYRDYYDPYYGLWYPYSYDYYRDYPQWYYDDYYYRDHDDGYVPKKKPETKRRGVFELRRTPRPGSKRESRLEEDEEKNQPIIESRDRQRAEDETQRPVRRKRRDSASGSERRPAKRKSQDEEE